MCQFLVFTFSVSLKNVLTTNFAGSPLLTNHDYVISAFTCCASVFLFGQFNNLYFVLCKKLFSQIVWYITCRDIMLQSPKPPPPPPKKNTEIFETQLFQINC